MTTTDWIIVVVAIAGGILAGIIVSRIVNAVIGAPSRPDPVRNAAGALASLAMSACVVIGLITALGIASPASLDQLPKDVIAFIPRLLSAAIILIVANVMSSFALAALAPALGRMPANVQRQSMSAVRITILSLAVLLAVRQLGFDTTVINLGVAAIFFGIAGALMLLVALGGRNVAAQVASTRALRRLFDEGDHVRMGGIEGTVVAVHPTAIELTSSEGETLLVPSSDFLSGTITIERAARNAAPDVGASDVGASGNESPSGTN